MFNLNIGGELTIMVSLIVLETNATNLSAKIALPTPKPVIIFTGMKIQEWEKFFEEETDKTSIHTEKYDYDQCRATLRWAQFCGAKSISLRVGKNSTGSTVEISFCFDSENDFNLFVNELDEMVEYIMYY